MTKRKDFVYSSPIQPLLPNYLSVKSFDLKMGVYYTCNICGVTEKGFWPCDCPQKETNRLIKLRIGCKIVEAFQDYNGANYYLYEKLQNAETFKFLYMATCLGSASGEHEDPWRITEITEANFNEHRDHNLLHDSESDEEEDNQTYRVIGRLTASGFSVTLYESEAILEKYPADDVIMPRDVLDSLRKDLELRGFEKQPRGGVMIENWHKTCEPWLQTENSDKLIEFVRIGPEDWIQGVKLFKIVDVSVVKKCENDLLAPEWTMTKKEGFVQWTRNQTQSKNARKKQRYRQNKKLREKKQDEERRRHSFAATHCKVLDQPYDFYSHDPVLKDRVKMICQVTETEIRYTIYVYDTIIKTRNSDIFYLFNDELDNFRKLQNSKGFVSVSRDDLAQEGILEILTKETKAWIKTVNLHTCVEVQRLDHDEYISNYRDILCDYDIAALDRECESLGLKKAVSRDTIVWEKESECKAAKPKQQECTANRPPGLCKRHQK